MFNSPVLDTAIGLVFIFLLYSLLATSINEGIATLFSTRARMLRKGIIEGMLSNTSDDNVWKSFLKTAVSYIYDGWRMIAGVEYPYKKNSLGKAFYEHPIIKNYGSRRSYSVPSYITKNNFSTVLIDTLIKYFDELKDKIAEKQGAALVENLPSITKINYLINYLIYNESLEIDGGNELIETKNSIKLNIKRLFLIISYGRYKKENDFKKDDSKIIDNETLQILQLHLNKSYLNMETFIQKIEGWYDDSMDRVSGWYKRQVQFTLFFLGIVIAIAFNVDIIKIAGKLSTDKDARDKLVTMAIKAADEYKDDPRIKKLDAQISKQDSNKSDTASDIINKNNIDSLKKFKEEYKKNINDAKALINGDINDANNLLALGWGDYGLKTDSTKIVNDSTYKAEIETIKDSLRKDTVLKKEKDTTAIYTQKALEQLYSKHFIKLKIGYILKNAYGGSRPLGFLLLAFAVCLGAPFWFDLLQKLIKLRAAGKKEDSENSTANTNNATAQPVQVTVNNNSNTGEAVG